MHINKLWNQYGSEPEFFKYFPDRFRKYPPSKNYFWKVFASYSPKIYQSLIESTKTKLLNKKIIKPNKITITEEAASVLNDFKNHDLQLLCIIISKKEYTY